MQWEVKGLIVGVDLEMAGIEVFECRTFPYFLAVQNPSCLHRLSRDKQRQFKDGLAQTSCTIVASDWLLALVAHGGFCGSKEISN